MSLPPGTNLGPYELSALLGAGGMGEVYRARDTRLDRTVAVKILRTGLTGETLRTRFEREARAISQLSHPHICTLYDVGSHESVEYLVMEYVEGETLADRIQRGPLPASQVLRFGVQIAEALEHAHRSGIAHRDLKPGNVLLAATGVKLLDFGLAKFVEKSRTFSDASAPETERPLTAEGTIVGTMQYMSPEQLHGTAVDHRSDIFSLGVVLYEMVTGRRPFPSTSSATLIAAIVSGDPVPIRSVQPTVSPALERIILTALEKSPDDRWQSAQDVARQLRWLADSSQSTTEASAPEARRAPIRTPLLLVATAVLAALAAAATTRLFWKPPATAGTAHLQLVPPDGVTLSTSPESPNFAVSPDGATVAFTGRQGGVRAVFLRSLSSAVVRKIEGSEGAFHPFWSPDGKWIGFSAKGKLWKAATSGGSPPQMLCEVFSEGAVASWAGHTILFTDRSGGRKEVYRTNDSGGPAEKVTSLKQGEWRHSYPRVLRDGRHYLYLASSLHSLERTIVLASLDEPETSVVLRNVSQVDLLRDDVLAYVRDGKLLTQRFDGAKGRLIGEPSLVSDNAAYFYLSARGQFSAAGGVLAYRTDTSTGRLTLMDRKGQSKVLDDQGIFGDVRFAPDGKRAAVTITERSTGLGDIWIYDLARGVKDRFTSEPGYELNAVWARDARSLVYSEAPGGRLPQLIQRSLSGGPGKPLAPADAFQFANSFTPRGEALYFTSLTSRTREDLFRLDLTTRKVTTVLASEFSETDAQVSPDGKWMAFVSDTTGPFEVYLVGLDSSNSGRIRVSQGGGSGPSWRADGAELVYLSGKKVLMSVVPEHEGDWTNIRTSEIAKVADGVIGFDMDGTGNSFLLLENARSDSDGFLQVILGTP